MSENNLANLQTLTAQIVSAHVGKNLIVPTEVPNFIKSVYEALANLGGSAAGTESVASIEPKAPAVPIKESVFPDYIVCLEDGRKMKTLKRHLLSAYNLTVDAYRLKWGLPPEYPMVAPNYAAQRSSMAKQIGLGKMRAAAQEGPASAKTSTRKAKKPTARKAKTRS